ESRSSRHAFPRAKVNKPCASENKIRGSRNYPEQQPRRKWTSAARAHRSFNQDCGEAKRKSQPAIADEIASCCQFGFPITRDGPRKNQGHRKNESREADARSKIAFFRNGT